MLRPIHVGLVDDHPAVIGGIEATLARTPDVRVAARADTIAAATEMLARSDLDVVLMDIRLPDGNGLELLARTMHAPRPAVIVLSSFEATQYIAAAMRFGAQGFLLKTAPLEDRVEAIRTVAAGGTVFAQRDLLNARYVALTPHERELVRLVIDARSNDEIASAFQTQRKTVETQLSRLYERLGVSSRVELAIRAEREGWLDVTPAGGVEERHGSRRN
jgi:DNA-binding NarL/FixJ family response regulator